MTNPGGLSVGMSFIECTAKSTSPVEQCLLDLLGEQAFASHRLGGAGR